MRVLRVIARMNAGGPAYHVSVLSGRLAPDRYETLLVHGSVGPGEASLAWLAEREGCRVEQIDHLRPEIRPLSDLRALVQLLRIVRRFRPHVVHTHTAKAGMLGRLAGLLAGRPRPVIVHTYHGHVLEGYFGPLKNSLYRRAERSLARASDCLVGVSQATVDDLVRLGVGGPDRFRVIPIGLDLERFVAGNGEARERFRSLAGAARDDVLLSFVGRLVPIKRVDVALRALARVREGGAAARLAIVGDGECRARLERLAEELGLTESVVFLGYMDDMPAVTAGSDIALLSSDNEGTPVSLIEAGAGGRPAVATAVGGVPDVVLAGETGFLVEREDEVGMARAVQRLVEEPELRARMGARAREHVLGRFSSGRLLRDVETLYDELLARRAAPAP